MFWLLPLSIVSSSLLTPFAYGQFQVTEPSEEEALAENVFLPAPRSTLQRLDEARELLALERFGEAVRNLGSILDAQEDFFFQPDRNEPIHRSLKAEAQRLLGDMPKRGRDIYELQYGPHARTMLEEALTRVDVTKLAEVSRRFFHTQAGYEATFLLGLHHLDHGRALAAALTLQRLISTPEAGEPFQPALSLASAAAWLQAGGTDRAAAILADLKESRGGTTPRLGSRQIAWFSSPGRATDWLAGYTGSGVEQSADGTSQWTLVRGSPSRNAAAGGGTPLLNVRWEVPIADDPIIERLLAQQQQQQVEQGVPPIPELHPLVVDDLVLMRTTRNLLAVDIHTGKRVWEVPVDDPLESLLQVSPDDRALQSQLQHVPLAVRERVLEDRTYGTLSSDGQQVYTIEDLVPSAGVPNSRQLVRGAVRVVPGQPQPYNRLAAHEIRTGKLKWHLGGPTDEFALRMAETFFLGPPLPLRGQLFTLVEAKGEIRLLALDAATGDLVWSQSLAMVEEGVMYSPTRRLSGLSPAYADGILVCPTGAGALVAVDLATRSLLWGYCYSQNNAARGRAPFFAIRLGVHSGQQPETRWSDPIPIVVDGRVLMTPTDSDTLYCLNLEDGKQCWTAPRQEDLYLACVHKGEVILVGRTQVRALALADGKPAWDGRTLEFPENAMPSGHGFYSGSQYFVPLTTAEIAVVDLDRGRTVHIAHSRQGDVPGNLISYQGKVLSQSAGCVAAFEQVELLRKEADTRLAANPDDAAALALRGELLLDDGKRDEAIANLSRSYELEPDRRTASLLRLALLDGLRNDFPAYQGRVSEIEPLLDGPREQAEFLRVMANGLQQSERWSDAFAYYLKLVELDEDRRHVEPIDRSLSVRGDRWIRARLTALRADAVGEDAAEIEQQITARMQAAIEADTPEALARFLEYFGEDAGTAAAREALVQALTEAGKLLEVEMMLWGKPGVVNSLPDGEGLARVAQLLTQFKHENEAQAAYRCLNESYTDIVCLDGKTGRQLMEALPKDDAARPPAEGSIQWPVGRIDAQEIVANRPPTQGRYPLDFRGDPGPFFRGMVIRMDQSRRAISATDGLGRVRWSLPLVEPGNPHSFAFNPATTYVRACGHLLVLSLGYRIIAIDTLGSSGQGQVRVLWSQDLTEGGFDQSILRIAAQGGARWPQRIAIVQQGSHQLGSLGPVTPRYVCFQHYRNVIAVDPTSGETLWVRHGVAPGSTLFGDRDYVLAASPEESDILVLSALDGSLIGRRSIPATEHPVEESGDALPAVQRHFGRTVMTTFGRHIVLSCVDPTDGQQISGLFDPVEQRYVWGPLRTAIGKTAHIEDELIGLLAPDGTLRLIRMEDGRVLVEQKLPDEASASELHLLRSGDQYMVITNRPLAREQGLRINPLPGTHYRPIGKAHVYSYDREGRSLWPKPAVVKQQLLVLHQPENLPIFAFAGQSYDPKQAGADRFTAQVVCLDKRNGRVVYRGGFSGPTATFEIVGNPDDDSVEIQLQRNVVKLQMTDQPLPPEEPEPEDEADSEDESAQAELAPVQPGTAVLRALGGAIKQLGGLSGDPKDLVPRLPPAMEIEVLEP